MTEQGKRRTQQQLDIEANTALHKGAIATQRQNGARDEPQAAFKPRGDSASSAEVSMSCV